MRIWCCTEEENIPELHATGKSLMWVELIKEFNKETEKWVELDIDKSKFLWIENENATRKIKGKNEKEWSLQEGDTRCSPLVSPSQVSYL